MTIKNYSPTRLILAAAALLPLGLMFSACNSSKAADDESAENSGTVAVKVITLQKTQLGSKLKLPGEVKPYQFADLYAKVNSYVKIVNVDMGSQVTAGQVLATLEAPEMNTQLMEAQSRLHTREAMFRASSSTYNRLLKTSRVPGTISPNDLEMALEKMSADSAELLSARSSYQEVQQMLGYLVIRAPFSGIITQRNIHPGTYVGPAGKGSDKPLFRLEEQRKLRLAIAVPEVYTDDVRHATDVKFTVRSMPGDTFTAKVNRIAGSLDVRLRSEQLEMDINNTDGKLLPGMYAEVNVPLPGKKDVYVVPKGAIVVNSEKVFVIKSVNGKAVWVPVERGNESNGMVEIFGGLSDNDMIVQNATDEIKEGTALHPAK
ncbi:efflux RND transporter periplasmic adaptor subunit [Chitinophaga sp. Cy-1792]|uniref:efflux RND transporter periplasmic adaptor subunit n=1 Tax=Chitinophaga sp. Cy-1792 TaxID=2608339 RepID=UPI00141E3085|nr:efflux RND transporter periplasmic adaptor subunit [Chitinophaga sp. Cy-1792]NIG52244.1 efflux RND transporter periplasmic adaptor subunit [Chitinophaga sp. Cy-1792]